MTRLAERITVDPAQCGGRPCVRGMRIRVKDVLDLLANGLTPEQILHELPDLVAEDIRACPRFASQRLDLLWKSSMPGSVAGTSPRQTSRGPSASASTPC